MLKVSKNHLIWLAVPVACVALFFALRIPATVESQSPPQVPLDPVTIPKFAHELPIPRVFAPTVTRNAQGQVIRHDYTVSVAQTQVQMLPPGYPATSVFAYGGQVKIPGSSQTEFVRSVPGPIFDNTRGIPARVTWVNEMQSPHMLPVDPSLHHWANPQHMEAPAAPFTPFPSGYANAQSPLAHVTHNHGLVIAPHIDGTAEEWYTPEWHRGPTFVSSTYDMPNQQPSTQLFYHDHTMGMTRLGVYAGTVGAAYYIRDPNAPLDQANSPLPKGQYEIPLVVFDRAFFTDGQVSFPRVSTNPGNAYWQAGDGANTVLVNGKVWPNLNVERRQYRFRMLAAGNGRTWTFQFTNNNTPVPFTIIGSDGGYLPAPQSVTQVILGITERADVLFDFSQFAPGTQIILINAGADPDTVGTVMRFTVQNTPQVAPPALSPSLFPARAALPTNAPVRIKTMMNHIDAAGNAMRSVDGLDFTAPPTELPLIGSTEEWVLINVGGGGHQMHIHLLEFQVIDRQTIDTAAYLQQWNLMNGFRPVTRPIVVDPTPFLTGSPTAALPYETGWKDTARAPSNQVTRIRVRWAPQEVATGGVTPGQNLFPIDPQFPPSVDPFTGPGYVWHCHVLGHEDNDMMRPLAVVNSWAAGVSYPVGRAVAYQNVNYRVRVTHTSQASQPPPNRFDLWERVNNNDGTWQPQIIYAAGDRVLHNGQLYEAHSVHQAQTGQPPPSNSTLWHALPMTASGQLVEFCADNTSNPVAAQCLATGQAGDEAASRAQLGTCLAVCQHVHTSPCAGLCNNPVPFTVADGSNFQSGPLGTGAGCFETTSELLSGTSSSFTGGRQLTVNGRVMPNGGNWTYPLPTQRHHGYCIQTTPGNQPWAAFSVW